MYHAIDAAEYVISKCAADGCPVSNLRLQNILYCIQREFLASGRCAFPEEFEAWQFGPAIPEVYGKYYGSGSLPIRFRYDVVRGTSTGQLLPDNRYRAITDPIIKRARELGPQAMADDILSRGKAWDTVYDSGAGNHHVIPKELIRTMG